MHRAIRAGEADQARRQWRASPLNVNRDHHDSHNQLRTHLADFMPAYNFARRLKTIDGLTPCEYICKSRTESASTRSTRCRD
ncbi:hypothetical protein DSD19_21250 [Rhodovulum sp. BSW8]|nr:hypothetical protein DSD19_21250 [Rhodovulum sp. BSW8]